jgi:hypothetical protein
MRHRPNPKHHKPNRNNRQEIHLIFQRIPKNGANRNFGTGPLFQHDSNFLLHLGHRGELLQLIKLPGTQPLLRTNEAENDHNVSLYAPRRRHLRLLYKFRTKLIGTLG